MSSCPGRFRFSTDPWRIPAKLRVQLITLTVATAVVTWFLYDFCAFNGSCVALVLTIYSSRNPYVEIAEELNQSIDTVEQESIRADEGRESQKEEVVIDVDSSEFVSSYNDSSNYHQDCKSNEGCIGSLVSRH
jgi:hypothetical protein